MSGVKRILCYEVLSSTEWGEGFWPNVYVPIDIYAKLRAWAEYKTEHRGYPHPRSEECIMALARKRGTEAYVEYAEAFYLVREVL
jgi:hypothetical protein